MNMTNRKCPYTGEECHDQHCILCRVEKKEREWLEKLEKEEEKYLQSNEEMNYT
jgi:hypothetical protein